MKPTRQQIVAALEAMTAEVKARRMEMGFHEREAWRPLYDDEAATAVLDLLGGETPPPPATPNASDVQGSEANTEHTEGEG